MAKSDEPKKKTKRGVTADLGGVKIRVKTAKPKKAKDGTKAKVKVKDQAKAKASGAFDSLSKLADSPLVADLIAVGATAAVAALAEAITDKDGKHKKSSVKNAGKAAATAIGTRLMNEFSALKDAAKKK
ncbi:hypothetical protein ABDK56_04110 [Sphingomonas sp. ASV193]|uniref:hypothetical protein n=1 Tax=Sphingomonas sp. ASV193 TaxID=3144405 RepID=UPI0032E92F7B